jgi:hypothetical protein
VHRLRTEFADVLRFTQEMFMKSFPSAPRCLSLAGLLASALCAACSTQQTYATGQAWQRGECNKIIDTQDRRRCMERANESFDTYQRQVDSTRTPARTE